MKAFRILIIGGLFLLIITGINRILIDLFGEGNIYWNVIRGILSIFISYALVRVVDKQILSNKDKVSKVKNINIMLSTIGLSSLIIGLCYVFNEIHIFEKELIKMGVWREKISLKTISWLLVMSGIVINSLISILLTIIKQKNKAMDFELFNDELFPPTKEELLQILKTLKEKLENKEFEEDWENLRLQYTFRKNQLENKK